MTTAEARLALTAIVLVAAGVGVLLGVRAAGQR